jgi:pyridoxine kinase
MVPGQVPEPDGSVRAPDPAAPGSAVPPPAEGPDAPLEVLLVGDTVGRGAIALSASVPLLALSGHRISQLPTAVVSNTFDWGAAALHPLTDWMRESVDVWTGHGFAFDVVSVGFLAAPEQAGVVADLVAAQQTIRGRRPFVLFDPIMGDNGSLYLGLGPDTVTAMRAMVPAADLVVPNPTEAALLLDRALPEDGFTTYPQARLEEQTTLASWIDGLQELGAGSVLITSATVDGRPCVAGRDGATGETFAVPYRRVDAHLAGAGDVFTALLLMHLLDAAAEDPAADVPATGDPVTGSPAGSPFAGVSLRAAVEATVDLMSDVIAAEVAAGPAERRNGREVREISINRHLDRLTGRDRG